MNAGTALQSTVRGRDGSSLLVPALIVVAWSAMLAAEATGLAASLHHHALIEGGLPLWIATPLFLAGWQVMVVAMMLPASTPTIRAFESIAGAVRRPPNAKAVFLAALLLVWTMFGLAAFAGDIVLHHVVDTTPWLAARPWLIEAGILAVAGAYQFAPLKRRSLDACRHPGGSIGAAGRLGRGPVRAGLGHGLACLGSSGALMLVMFGEGFASLGWMAVLTAVMLYETVGKHGRRAAALVGIGLFLLALSVLDGGIV